MRALWLDGACPRELCGLEPSCFPSTKEPMLTGSRHSLMWLRPGASLRGGGGHGGALSAPQ